MVWFLCCSPAKAPSIPPQALAKLEPDTIAAHVTELIRRLDSGSDRDVRRGAIAAVELQKEIAPQHARAVRRWACDADPVVSKVAARLARRLES